MRAFWDTKAYLDIYINRRQFWKRKTPWTFVLEEAILRRKNSTVEGWWNGDTRRYHQKWSEAIDQKTQQFLHQVHDDLSVLSVVCAEKKVWNLRRGPRTPWRSLALPYFNSEDSQRFTIWKVTRRNVVFYYHLVRANTEKPHIAFEKKRRWKNFFFQTPL